MKEKIKHNITETMVLSTLSGAAAGEVSFCCFCHVGALLKDVAQTLREVQVRICNIGESKAVSLKLDAVSFSSDLFQTHQQVHSGSRR